jgi:hypothetical protein
MVAPLIVGAARVATRKVAARTGKRLGSTKNSFTKPSSRSRFENATTDSKDINTAKTSQPQKYRELPKYAGKISGTLPDKAQETLEKLNTYSTCLTIFWTAIPLWFLQFTFWIFGLIGLSLESLPIANFVLDGEELYIASVILIGAIGVITMVYAASFMYMRGVSCFRGYKSLVCILATTFYFVTFINVFPWFTLWLFAVVMLEERQE